MKFLDKSQLKKRKQKTSADICANIPIHLQYDDDVSSATKALTVNK